MHARGNGRGGKEGASAGERRADVRHSSVRISRNTGRGVVLNYDEDELSVDVSDTSGLDPKDYSLTTRLAVTRLDTLRPNNALIERLLAWIGCPNDEHAFGFETPGAVLVFLPGIAEITMLKAFLLSSREFSDPQRWHICALHSQLTMKEQAMAFKVPNNATVSRKIVLSTNIAETGVTIPDVVFVVDTCLVKETRFNQHNRMRSLVQCHVPRSSGEQRRGRAGRFAMGTAFDWSPGHSSQLSHAISPRKFGGYL